MVVFGTENELLRLINQNEMRLYTLLVLCMLSFTVLAQPENPVYEEIDGRQFYIHIVQGGNTLYGLSKLYQVSAEKIIEHNPTAATGLQIGQKIIIPVGKKEETAIENITVPDSHHVEKGDNLYNISKRYGVTMEDLVKLNPGVENGIAIGQELKLPSTAKITKTVETVPSKTQITFTDSIVYYTVLPHETLYSISKRFMVSMDEIRSLNDMKNDRLKKNEVIKIPVKKEKITQVQVRKIEEVQKEKTIDESLSFRPKATYKIFYLLPFNLDGGSQNLRELSTEFLMGAQIALDSLEKLGLKAKVEILDVTNDTLKFKQLLESKNVQSADLIIGPFMGSHVDIAARFAKENKIRMVSPLNPSASLLKDNPYVYNSVNSDITLIEGSAEYLAKHNSADQIVLIKVGAKDEDLYQAFRLKFKKSLPNDSKAKLIECNQADMGNFIKKGGNTIFVVPSTDKVLPIKFMNDLEKVSSKAGASGKIIVFATKDWINNDEIRGYYKNKYEIHYASPYDFNYSYDDTKQILKKYRLKYNADLSKYGTQGFDVSYYFIQSLLLQKDIKNGVMNQFTMKKVASGSGFENKTCFIMKQENYELIRLDIINE